MVNKTRANIICLALRLIQQKGYSSFSYDDIAKQLNITKAAIHYYFESKEDLGLAICEKIENGIINMYEEIMQNINNKTGSPWDFIDSLLAIIQPDENCPISSLQSNFESLSVHFQDEIKKLSTLQMNSFLNLVKQYAPEIDEMSVITLFSSIKGALQYRRIMGEPFFNQVMQTIKNQYNTMISSAE